MVSTVMFIRPRRPDDHEQFEWLLPQCQPLFVYADARGRDWVRWAVPSPIAQRLGWSSGCSCCGHTEEASEAPQNAFLADMAYDEIDWFMERQDA